MVKTKSLFTRSVSIASVVALAAAALVPGLLIGSAQASLVQDRSILMDSSVASASTFYTVQFELPTNYGTGVGNLEGIVVEFCDETPIIGDPTCTAPAGFSINTTPTYDNLHINATAGGGAEIVDWVASDLADNGRTFILTNSTGIDTAANDIVKFDITSVTNPSTTNHSFYARIYTYDDSAAALAYLLADVDPAEGDHVDDGGIAMSTANQMTITSKVQERLTFCVYSNANCGAGGNSIVLGDAQGVLDPDAAYVNNQTKFDIATNALSGAQVVMKGDTLESAAYSITALGTPGAVSLHETEQFGMCLWQSAGSGITPVAPYDDSVDCATAPQGINVVEPAPVFAFDTSAVNGTMSQGGDVIATKVPGYSSTATLAFLGNIDYVTEAGIYTTTLTFIATGTY
jgi:hypothetical protein